MKINVVIETKDRRLNGMMNYLGVTLGNLKRAGVFESEHLGTFSIVGGGEMPGFFDEEIYPVLRHVPRGNDGKFIFAPPDGCTRHQNAARAIREGARVDSDWVIKLEDDLDFIDDFLGSTARWLEDVGRAAVPMFSLGATFEFVSKSLYADGETILGPGESFPRVRAMMERGDPIVAHPVNGFWGAQALLWTSRMARHLGAWLGDDPFLWDGREALRHRGHDLLLQVWGNQLKARAFGCAIPSFVQHIGRQSNLSQPEINHVQPFFQFPWPGREWSYQRRANA